MKWELFLSKLTMFPAGSKMYTVVTIVSLSLKELTSSFCGLADPPNQFWQIISDPSLKLLFLSNRGFFKKPHLVNTRGVGTASRVCITVENYPTPPVFRWGYLNTEKILYCCHKMLIRQIKENAIYLLVDRNRSSWYGFIFPSRRSKRASDKT